jgi:hypothetical protein
VAEARRFHRTCHRQMRGRKEQPQLEW